MWKIHNLVFKNFHIIFGLMFVFSLTMIGLTLLNSTFNGGQVSLGWNGSIETRCIDGFKYTVDQRGFSRQVLNENGGGMECSK